MQSSAITVADIWFFSVEPGARIAMAPASPARSPPPSHSACCLVPHSPRLPKGGAANLAMVGEPQTLDPMASHRRPGRHDHAARLRAALHVRRQLERGADAGREHAGDLEGRPGLHDRAAQGRQVPQRQGDDLRRRRRFAAALDGDGAARQGRRQGDQGARGEGPEHDRRSRSSAPMRRCWRIWRCRTASPRSWRRTRSPRRSRNSSAPAPTSSRSASPTSTSSWCASTATAARSEPPSGYAGKREALLDELRFVPVPNANTRVEGSLSGQYHFADLLPVESYARLESARRP